MNNPVAGRVSFGLDENLHWFRLITFASLYFPENRDVSDFPPTIEELLETFEDLQEWDERYDFIIDLGRELPPMPAEYQDADHVVEGCMSTVWMHAQTQDAQSPMTIDADSDSIIVKGLIVLLLSFYNGQTPREIVESDASEYLKSLGLSQHLSPQRRNGLFSMIKRLKVLAAMAVGS